MIPLFYPYISRKARKAVQRTLKSKFVGQGPQVDEFEKEFRYYLNGCNYGVATNSCTSALHLAYILADIKEGDEVLTTVLTCTATNLPLLWMKAKPVFVDINKKDLNIDVEDLKRKITDKTRAIVVVHFGGMPADLYPIQDLAEEHNIPLIQDAAQALGATYCGKKIGAIGDLITFSFQAIKMITTGDGGMLIVSDLIDKQKAEKLRWFGIDRKLKIQKDWQPVSNRSINYDVCEIGYKYQMTDIAAAMGIANLEDMNKILEHRKMIAEHYRKNLEAVPGLQLLKKYEQRESSNWLFQVLVDDRDAFQKKLKEEGIETNISHVRNDVYKVFGGKKLDLPNMNAVEDRYICIPIHQKLSWEDIRHVVTVIRGGW